MRDSHPNRLSRSCSSGHVRVPPQLHSGNEIPESPRSLNISAGDTLRPRHRASLHRAFVRALPSRDGHRRQLPKPATGMEQRSRLPGLSHAEESDQLEGAGRRPWSRPPFRNHRETGRPTQRRRIRWRFETLQASIVGKRCRNALVRRHNQDEALIDHVGCLSDV
jgi:hypothetical protein